MAWFRCIGNSGGGSDNNRYTYNIQTTSVGGGDAAIKVTQYDKNGSIIVEQNIVYDTVQQDYITIGDIQIGYPNDWVVKVAIGSSGVAYNNLTYSAGEVIATWGYDSIKNIFMQTVEGVVLAKIGTIYFDFDETDPDREYIYLSEDGENWTSFLYSNIYNWTSFGSLVQIRYDSPSYKIKVDCSNANTIYHYNNEFYGVNEIIEINWQSTVDGIIYIYQIN